MRKRRKPTSYPYKLTVMLDKEDYSKLVVLADARKVTLTEAVRKAVDAACGRLS